jgi:hypothetical protein
MLKGLEAVRNNPDTGYPEPTTEPFVKAIYEQNPETAIQLLRDLSNQPSPFNKGYTLMQEIFKASGIPPERIDDIKQFVANGYQNAATNGQYPPPDPEDLKEIPAQFREAFASLSPDERESLLIETEAIRDKRLEDRQIALDARREREGREKTEAEQKQQQEQRQQQEFQQAVQKTAIEMTSQTEEKVFNSFVDSLATGAKLPKSDAFGIANTVLNALDPTTMAGRASLAYLKEQGVELDAKIQPTIIAMQEAAFNAAYFKQAGNEAQYQRAVAQHVEQQERLLALGNKVISQLAAKKAQSLGNGQPAALTQNPNRYVNGSQPSLNQPTNGQQPADFSEETYRQLLAQSGFGG